MRNGPRRYAYRLARRLGFLDVDAMLAQIPAWKFHEWHAFEQLEPDGDARNEWGFAHVVQALVRNGKPLRDFRLAFGDASQTQIKQSIAQQELLIDAWIIGSNAALAAKAGRVNG